MDINESHQLIINFINPLETGNFRKIDMHLSTHYYKYRGNIS